MSRHLFFPVGILAQLQADDSVIAAPQQPAVGWRPLRIDRRRRLVVQVRPVLGGDSSRFALARYQRGIEKQLGNGPLAGPNLDCRRADGFQSSRLLSVSARPGCRMELPDDAFGQALLDVAGILPVA